MVYHRPTAHSQKQKNGKWCIVLVGKEAIEAWSQLGRPRRENLSEDDDLEMEHDIKQELQVNINRISRS